MGSLLIARDKAVPNKVDSSLPLELYWYNISGYHMMLYHIICPSIPLCVYSYPLFSFHYYVTSFVFYQKQNVRRAFNVISGVIMKAVAFER